MSKETIPSLSRDTIVQGRYRIRRVLGRGGMGIVYQAVDERLSRNIALKVTTVESDELRRAFHREAKLLANLQHPALPRVMDHFSERDEQFLVMEFVPGEDLAQLLRVRGHPFPCRHVLRWADNLLDALIYLHGHQPPVIHRDIKPSNLKQTIDGHIILLDFGLAKGAPGLMSGSGDTMSVIGYSPHYAPLEQIRGDATSPQSDLYSLAATLYILLTNYRPDDALKRAAAVVEGHSDPLKDIREINSDIPEQFASSLMQALSLCPEMRPRSAAVMRTALTGVDPISPLKDRNNFVPISNEQENEVTLPQSSFWGTPQRVEALVHSAQAVPGYSEDRSSLDVYMDFQLPNLEVLNAPPTNLAHIDETLLDRATDLSEMFAAQKIKGEIVYVTPGPVATTYEFTPGRGANYSSIAKLDDEICHALKAPWANIHRIPGTDNIGIQVPNLHRRMIYLRELIESEQFRESNSKLTVVLGKATNGVPYVLDLSRLPHILIAGGNSAGKSILINTLIVSILYKARPDEVKFIMIGPKRAELGIYADIPHLVAPIIMDSELVTMAFDWAAEEMQSRIEKVTQMGVTNMSDLNSEVRRRRPAIEPPGSSKETLPSIVIIVDELADVGISDGRILASLIKLARAGRLVGMHLVLATQRPSIDVITHEIKESFPTRVALQVSSAAESRRIIDSAGAEGLLGFGDMLLSQPNDPPVRLHGAFIDDEEIKRIVYLLKMQARPHYDAAIRPPNPRNS